MALDRSRGCQSERQTASPPIGRYAAGADDGAQQTKISRFSGAGSGPLFRLCPKNLLLSFSSDLSCQSYIWQPHVKIIIVGITGLISDMR
jgi:hypothetical protein